MSDYFGHDGKRPMTWEEHGSPYAHEFGRVLQDGSEPEPVGTESEVGHSPFAARADHVHAGGTATYEYIKVAYTWEDPDWVLLQTIDHETLGVLPISTGVPARLIIGQKGVYEGVASISYTVDVGAAAPIEVFAELAVGTSFAENAYPSTVNSSTRQDPSDGQPIQVNISDKWSLNEGDVVRFKSPRTLPDAAPFDATLTFSLEYLNPTSLVELCS